MNILEKVQKLPNVKCPERLLGIVMFKHFLPHNRANEYVCVCIYIYIYIYIYTYTYVYVYIFPYNLLLFIHPPLKLWRHISSTVKYNWHLLVNDWATKSFAICLYINLSLCCYGCWPSRTLEGVQGGVRHSMLKGIWSLDSWMISGTDFMMSILASPHISFQFSCSVESISLQPRGMQHTRHPCPSPTSRAYPNSCILSRWCHPTISSSAVPFLLLPSIFPSIRVFESVLCIRWPKYWRFSFSISPSNEYSRLICLRIDWLDLLAVRGTLKSFLQHHSSKTSIFQC